SDKEVTMKPQRSIAKKETQQHQQPRDLQPNETTGQASHGNTVIRECGNKGKPSLSLSPKSNSSENIGEAKKTRAACLSCAGDGCPWCNPGKRPSEQTDDEWLADYGAQAAH